MKKQFVALLLAALCTTAVSSLINGTAGRVGKTVITVEDARFFDALLKLRDGTSLSSGELDDAALRAATQKLVFEEMVLAEMRSLQTETNNRRVAEERVKVLKSQMGDGPWKDFLAKYRRNEAAALRMIEVSQDVEKFLEKKVETLTPVITEAEAEQYYTQNQAKYAGTTFEAVKPTVVRLLQKQEMEKGLGEWVRLLRDKHRAVNLLER